MRVCGCMCVNACVITCVGECVDWSVGVYACVRGHMSVWVSAPVCLCVCGFV